MRSAHAANASVGPRQRSSSTLRNSGASVLSVARCLNSSARSRRVAEHRRRKVFDRAVPVQEPRRRDRADARNARIAVRRVADEREEVGDQRRAPRRTSRARRPHRGSSCPCGRSAPRGRRARTARGPCRASRCRPSRTRSSSAAMRAAEASASSASSSTIGQTATPIARERFLQRVELREQRRLDAVAGLVAGPEVVAKRLDDVIGRDADVRRALLDHLQHRLQHADHARRRAGPALC